MRRGPSPGGALVTPVACACPCGHAAFTVVGPPLFRIVCHCTICQRFNDAPFADVLIYDAAKVAAPAAGTVDFDTYKPPPNVQRGKCAQCGKPAIEQFRAPLFPALTMVPAAVHAAGSALPDPVAHIFYDTRVADVADSLPKHRGFLPSQLAFGRHLLAAKFSAK